MVVSYYFLISSLVIWKKKTHGYVQIILNKTAISTEISGASLTLLINHRFFTEHFSSL